MSNIQNGIEGLIGSTPLLKCKRYGAALELKAELFAKIEYMNPAGSVKDRAALSLILDAESRGKLKPGDFIIEPTSGNTGIGLAAVGAARGYKVILTMPDTMSAERRALLRAYGAQLMLTDGALGMSGAIEKANELASSLGNSYIPGQFENPANPDAHYRSTGVEIWRDMDGDVDCFVAGVGTGGTISGVGKYLKEKNPDVKIIAVEPFDSPMLSEGRSGSHGLQGIGANFVPKNLDRSLIDDIITVRTNEAYCAARDFAASEGILIGISGGAALFAASRLARRAEYANKRIVTLFPDSGERYLSTNMFSRED